MIKDLNVDITIKDTTTGAYLRIPVLPEVISYQDGPATPTTVNILQLGTVDFFNGVDLDGLSFSSFFPARYDAGYCKTTDLEEPTTYRDTLSGWKADGRPLQIIIPAAGINKTMYVQAFDWDLKGFEGDLYYSLAFREHKDVRPIQISTAAAVVSKKANVTPAARTPVPTPSKGKTYTVKPGDTLTRIAKQLGIPNWNTLYAANKATIGPNPSKIIPGQVLKV